MLMECRSSHRTTWFNGCPSATREKVTGKCNIRDYTFFQTFGGFQWYDVNQQHILTNSIFRNCRADWNRCVWGPGGNCSNVAVFTSLTHSDQFVPELMQVTSGIVYQNVSDLWRFSTKTTSSAGITVSGRLQSWYDADGSAGQTGGRSMIGSTWSNDWWKYNSGCEKYIGAWKCRMDPSDSAASVIIKHNSTAEAAIGKEVCMNGGGKKPCPVIGTLSHFGSTNESAGLQFAINAKVSGPLIASSGGWFLRFNAGTPKVLRFTSVQVMEIEDVFLVAIPYPVGTNFTIYHKAASWCSTSWGVCRHEVRQVYDLQSVIRAFGDAYYWNNAARTLYLRLVQTNQSFGNKGTDVPAWSPITPEEIFSRGGHTLIKPSYRSSIVVESSCSTNPCAPQNSVPVPAVLLPAGIYIFINIYYFLYSITHTY